MDINAKKINIVGTSGSGKSTFSKRLSTMLSREYIEMDALFWNENWSCPSEDVFLSRLKIALEKSEWILDGNYSNTIPVKWKNIDMVIWLDFSFSRTFFQALKRAITRIFTKEELWAGNKETFKKTFLSKDSILLWTIKTYKRNRIQYEMMMLSEQYSHIRFIRLLSPKDCSEYLKNNIKHQASL